MSSSFKKSTYDAYDAVAEFHRLNTQLIHEEPPLKEPFVPGKVGQLRGRLIIEEFGETCVALHQGNLVEFADGLADLLYVVMGTGVSFGIPLADPFLGPHEPIGLADEYRALAFYQGGCVGLHQVTQAIRDACVSCDCQDPTCDRKTADQQDYDTLQEALVRFTRFIGEVANKHGIPLREVFFEVHRSNLSKKLGGATDGKKYGEGGGKGAGYTPPDVEGILNRARMAREAQVGLSENAPVN